MSCTVVIKDKNLKPENIKMGITILKVNGTFEGNEPALEEKTVNSSTLSQEVLPGEGFDGLSKVTVNPYTLDSKTVNSSTSQQTVTSSADGLSSVTVEPYTLDSKAVDPSTSEQVVTSSADGLSSVTVNAVTSSIDSNIQADNIKKDVTILGVTGTLEEGGSVNNQNKTVNSSTSNQTVTYDSGYTGLGTVTVNKYTLDTKAVDPSTSQQVVTSSVDGLSSVTVNAVTSSIDSNIQADNIKKDVTILGVTGTYEPAPTQPNLQDVSVTYTQNGNYTVSASDGYDGLGTVDVSVNVPSSGGSDWVIEAKSGNITDISGYSIAKLAKKQSGAMYLFTNSSITSLPRIQDPVDNPNGDVGTSSLKQTFSGCKSLQSVDISVGSIGGEGMSECFAKSGVMDASIYASTIIIDTFSSFSQCFNNCDDLRNLYIHLGPNVSGTNSIFYRICFKAGNAWNNNDNTSITIEGLKEVASSALYEAFSQMHTDNSGVITLNIPDNMSTIKGKTTESAFSSICSGSRLADKTTPSFLGKLDYINGISNLDSAFASTNVETATLGFNTCIGNYNFSSTLNSCQNLKSVTFDGSFNVSGSNNFSYTFSGCGSLTSMTCTSTAGTKPFRDNGNNNVASSAPGITDVTIDNVNSDVYLRWNSKVNAASVYGILSKAVGATVQEGDARKIEFYSSGLTVTDFEDGRIQTAYNAAVADGWTINNLTINPHS